MPPQGTETQQPVPEHPRENKGLVQKLKELLTHQRVETPISEGSAALDDTAEHHEVVGGMMARREQGEAAAADKAELRKRAVNELGGASGVVTASPEDVERKMAEIATREAQTGQTPAVSSPEATTPVENPQTPEAPQNPAG